MTMPENDPRLSKGYQPNFDIDMRVGQSGELFSLAILDGINAGTVEVKTDVRASETGNLFIESFCKNRAGTYYPSGITKTKATHWAFVLGGEKFLLVIATDDLKGFIVDCSPRVIHMNRGSNPTTGYLVPIHDLVAWLFARARNQEK